TTKGGPEARAHLDEAVAVRRRLATLLGYPSWQALRVENLAAPSAEWIAGFVADMEARLAPYLATEIEAMRQALLAEPGAPADLAFQDWDWRYADAKQRAAIGADPSALDPYLEFEGAWAGLTGLSEAVFGVRLVAHPERTGWHPDVRAYDMVDSRSGDLLCRLFVDPFVRHGKAGGAFADVLDPGDRAGRSGPARVATLALVLNSPLPADGDSLLSLYQASVMFHEYGHVLDFGLSTSTFTVHRQEWLPMDWIEGPSGFLERWSSQPAVVARYARHHRTGEPIPASLLEPLAKAEAKNTGLRTSRHLSMGWLDALLHGEEPIAIEAADRRSWVARGTPYVEGVSFPSTLVHLLAGYDAAIFGWVWVQALRDDLLSRFEREGMTSPQVGLAYRRSMLERSWLTDPLDGYAQFMGRSWSIDALLDRVARGAAPDT
ncbi:MAG TPA: M3 family metallopeptidase, partial [Candidatus Limnocylindrales bacterium]